MSLRVYRTLNNFDSKCNKCSLSSNQSICGHSYSRIQDTQLIIIAAYPAKEELKQGISLAPNVPSTKGNIDRLNAGRLLQQYLIKYFDNDPHVPIGLKPFYEKVVYTNMIKCSPLNKKGEKANVTDKHIRTCKNTWLEKEIAQISAFNPTCPILLCGSEATKLLGPKFTVFANRRKQFIYNNTHPVIITFNPVEVVRYTTSLITKSIKSSRGNLIVNEVKEEKIIFGSPTWHWIKDIESIKKLIIKNFVTKYNLNKDKSEYKKLIDKYLI